MEIKTTITLNWADYSPFDDILGTAFRDRGGKAELQSTLKGQLESAASALAQRAFEEGIKVGKAAR